jgi:hypothetical protein
MYESYLIVFSNSAGSDVLQMETTYTHYMGQIDYRVDVRRVTQGAHIKGLWLMRKKTWTVATAEGVRFARVRWETNFLLIF